MENRAAGILILLILLIIGGHVTAVGQTYDISSGGLPTITGASGASVSGSSSTTADLSVTINFGDVSPSNTNSIVKVVVPIATRSTGPYRVTAVVTGGTNINLQ